jgi:hypothetical protein
MPLPDLIDAAAAELMLLGDGALELFYAPKDWVNPSAKVMLVGITPGRRQASDVLRAARDALNDGPSLDDALFQADRVGFFSRPMRSRLALMLDGIGLNAALGLS